jgi:hypothetical protein
LREQQATTKRLRRRTISARFRSAVDTGLNTGYEGRFPGSPSLDCDGFSSRRLTVTALFVLTQGPSENVGRGRRTEQHRTHRRLEAARDGRIRTVADATAMQDDEMFGEL